MHARTMSATIVLVLPTRSRPRGVLFEDNGRPRERGRRKNPRLIFERPLWLPIHAKPGKQTLLAESHLASSARFAAMSPGAPRQTRCPRRSLLALLVSHR